MYSYLISFFKPCQTEIGHPVCSLAHQPFHASFWCSSYSSLETGQDEHTAIGLPLDSSTSSHSVCSRAVWALASSVLIFNHVNFVRLSSLVPIVSQLSWNRTLRSWTIMTEDGTLSKTDAGWCLSRSPECSCSSEDCIPTDDDCITSLAKYSLPNGCITCSCSLMCWVKWVPLGLGEPPAARVKRGESIAACTESDKDSVCAATIEPNSISLYAGRWAINLGQPLSCQKKLLGALGIVFKRNIQAIVWSDLQYQSYLIGRQQLAKLSRRLVLPWELHLLGSGNGGYEIILLTQATIALPQLS